MAKRKHILVKRVRPRVEKITAQNLYVALLATWPAGSTITSARLRKVALSSFISMVHLAFVDDYELPGKHVYFWAVIADRLHSQFHVLLVLARPDSPLPETTKRVN